MAKEGNYSHTEKGARGTTLRTDFGPDRSDDDGFTNEEARRGRLKGDKGDISHSIKNGKVPYDD